MAKVDAKKPATLATLSHIFIRICCMGRGAYYPAMGHARGKTKLYSVWVSANAQRIGHASDWG